MRIDRIEVQNFKRFEFKALELHPNFTLLVGDNGAGKTTWLDALAISSAIWLVGAPDSTLSSSGRDILESEVRLTPKRSGDRIQFIEENPVQVTAGGEIAGQRVSWTRQLNSRQKATENRTASEASSIIWQIYEQVRNGQNVVCPILAYYGAGRSLKISESSFAKMPLRQARRWDAFHNCFDEQIDAGELQEWFLRETIHVASRRGSWRPGFEVVKLAILRCIPESEDLWFDVDRAEIVISMRGEAVPFSLLSAGQRMMAALIADIAIKAVTQNAHLLPESTLGAEDQPWPRVLRDTPGIVLIDEIDVHLHPKWQRQVVGDLKSAFPSIQFVATTHSPQVIGEVPAEEIRILAQDGTISSPSVPTKGADSNWILDVVIPDAVSRDPQTRKLFDEIEDALDEDDLSAAELKIEQAREFLQGSDGELTGLESSLESLKMLAHEDHQ